MRRAVWLSAVVTLLFLSTGSTRAASWPQVQGRVSGLELCPQSICGAAVFVGIYQGQFGWNRHALGVVAVAVNHTPLPEPGGTAIITGGLWNMRVGLRQLSGPVEGFLVNNGDETFAVITELTIASGGIGSIAFEGILDHNVFPPTIKGLMSQ